MTNTQSVARKQRRRSYAGKRRWAAPLGISIFAFAIIGMIYTIGLSVQTIEKTFDKTEEKEYFNDFLLPVVMVDFPPFDTSSNISSIKALEASMWKTMMSNQDGEQFAIDDNGRQIIPTDIIMDHAQDLFGKNIDLHFVNFGEVDNIFEYDAEGECYHAPIFGATNLYTPDVKSIRRKGNSFVLRVGYISADAEWGEDKTGSKIAPEPEKYMIYTVAREKASKTAETSEVGSSASFSKWGNSYTYYITSIKKEEKMP